MIKHIFAAALIVSASATAFAQQPTEKTTPAQDQQQPNNQSNQFNSRDYSQIQSTEVPTSLRTTLQGDMYRGWESGRLYRHNNGDGYWLSTGSGANAKNYYFDKNGKAMKNSSGSNTSEHKIPIMTMTEKVQTQRLNRQLLVPAQKSPGVSFLIGNYKSAPVKWALLFLSQQL
jgi:hypothetical protein